LVARRAHNPEVTGSSPVPAKERAVPFGAALSFFRPSRARSERTRAARHGSETGSRAPVREAAGREPRPNDSSKTNRGGRRFRRNCRSRTLVEFSRIASPDKGSLIYTHHLRPIATTTNFGCESSRNAAIILCGKSGGARKRCISMPHTKEKLNQKGRKP
jgi:hypothetical protein